MTPRIVGIIQARMTSTRLPGKVLLPAVGTPLLQLMIERLRRAGRLDDVWIATTDQPASDPSRRWPASSAPAASAAARRTCSRACSGPRRRPAPT